MIRVLCSKKETVHLAFEMVNDIPEKVEDREVGIKHSLFVHVVRVLCGFKDFDAAKQLILKMIADTDSEERDILIYDINILITAYVKAGEIIQALEMVMLLECIGFYICNPLMFGFGRST
ncbi:pentatricopeptide repeat-containing protein, partial [Trifolium medium]|nr:pentatricopeptide repeat-containing protein [Trifolium medium]